MSRQWIDLFCDIRKMSIMKPTFRRNAVLLLLTSQLLAFCMPAAASFTYANFDSVSGLNMEGDAAQNGALLRLTRPSPSLAAAAWYDAKQQVASGFETTFTFQIVPSSGYHADGLAFVIQNSSATALGIHGGAKGYGGIPNSLAVEFDTYNDHEIAVQSKGTEPNSEFRDGTLANTGIQDLADNLVHTAKLTYIGGTLSVYLDDMANPRLTTMVDLSTLLVLDGGAAWVGLTAGTGEGVEEHNILSWSFSPIPEPTTMIAGALLLLPFGASALRSLRKNRAA
jgi:hypothetical protein